MKRRIAFWLGLGILVMLAGLAFVFLACPGIAGCLA
jgi:hypothetical protein